MPFGQRKIARLNWGIAVPTELVDYNPDVGAHISVLVRPATHKIQWCHWITGCSASLTSVGTSRRPGATRRAHAFPIRDGGPSRAS